MITSHVHSDVYLSLNGAVIPNHGYVEISEIGYTYDSALLCHTNRPPRYGSSPNLHSGGDWFAPDGTRVHGTTVPGYTRNRAPMVVGLIRTSGDPPEGIYRCTIQDAASTFQITAYVGLYKTRQGNLPYAIYCYKPHLSRSCHTVWWCELHSGL